jgi:molecular chaperone DnaK
MTITGGTSLPRDEIDRMVKDADSAAATEKQRREEAEARNQADNAIYAVEKALSESGDKVPAEEKADIEGKIEAAKESLKGTDVAAVKKATEDLLQASHKLAQAAYGQTGTEPDQAAAAAGGGGDQAAAGGDDVVEGEVVDEGDAS